MKTFLFLIASTALLTACGQKAQNAEGDKAAEPAAEQTQCSTKVLADGEQIVIPVDDFFEMLDQYRAKGTTKNGSIDIVNDADANRIEVSFVELIRDPDDESMATEADPVTLYLTKQTRYFICGEDMPFGNVEVNYNGVKEHLRSVSIIVNDANEIIMLNEDLAG